MPQRGDGGSGPDKRRISSPAKRGSAKSQSSVRLLSGALRPTSRSAQLTSQGGHAAEGLLQLTSRPPGAPLLPHATWAASTQCSPAQFRPVSAGWTAYLCLSMPAGWGLEKLAVLAVPHGPSSTGRSGHPAGPSRATLDLHISALCADMTCIMPCTMPCARRASGQSQCPPMRFHVAFA
jgi:hypothetical protein